MADATHEIISLIAPSIVSQNWEYNIANDLILKKVKSIEKDWQSIIIETLRDTKDRVIRKGRRHKPLLQYFESDVQDRLYGILKTVARYDFLAVEIMQYVKKLK